MEKVVSFIAWAAILQGVMLAMIYLFSRKHRSDSNKILGLFLLALLWEAVTIFYPGNEIGNYFLWDYFAVPEVKLVIPVLFFHYVVKKIGQFEKYKRFLKVLYVLWFVILSFTFINVGLFLTKGQSLAYFIGTQNLHLIFMTQQITAWVLAISVLFLSFHETVRYKNIVLSEYSDLSMLQIKWLRQFIFLMAPASLLWGGELLRIVYDLGVTSDIVFATWGVLFVFIYFISYKAFTQRDLFEETDQKNASFTQPVTDRKPAVISNLDEIIKQLEITMTQRQLYLQKELTVYDLSKEAGIPVRKISQSIKQAFSTNFSEWVNKYRVEKAQEYLSQYSQSNITIEGIGYDAGFKSRSAMYLAFKKITGKTPGDFKQ